MVKQNNYIQLITTISIFPGDQRQWVIYSEVSNSRANIRSPKKNTFYLPVRGWQYWDGHIWNGNNGKWQDDDTLTVTGKQYMSCLIFD